MNADDRLAQLEALAQRLGVRLSYEPMAGLVQNTGGLCRVKGEYRVIIDRRLKAPERVQILADALSRFAVGDQALGDEVRALLHSGPTQRSA